MTPTQFKKALSDLHLNSMDAASILQCADRSVRRWAAGDRAIPPTVAILLRLLLGGRISRQDIFDAQ